MTGEDVSNKRFSEKLNTFVADYILFPYAIIFTRSLEAGERKRHSRYATRTFSRLVVYLQARNLLECWTFFVETGLMRSGKGSSTFAGLDHTWVLPYVCVATLVTQTKRHCGLSAFTSNSSLNLRSMNCEWHVANM